MCLKLSIDPLPCIFLNKGRSLLYSGRESFGLVMETAYRQGLLGFSVI